MKNLDSSNGIKWVRYEDGSIDGIGKFSHALFKVLRVTPLGADERYVVDRLDTKASEMVPVRIVEEEFGRSLEEAVFQAEMYETEVDHDDEMSDDEDTNHGDWLHGGRSKVDFESYEFWNTVSLATRFIDKDGDHRIVVALDTFEFAADKTRWIKHTAPEETLSSEGSIEFRPLGV